MNRHSLPESLELLLDTMCNTFGGVMFIAISMVITLMICQRHMTPEKQIEAEKKRLEACRQEHQFLEKRYEHEQKRLERIKKLAHSDENDGASDLAAAVVKLEQELRELKRQRDTLESEIKITEEQTRRLAQKNSRQEQQNRQKKQLLANGQSELEAENRRLADELGSLQAVLQNTPVKRVDFARNEKTSRIPYVMIIKNNRLFCAGSPPLLSSERVDIRREGNILRFFPLQGVPLNSIDARNVLEYCPGYFPEAHFFWIMVSDDSLAAFVKFRRTLRAMNHLVYWYTANRYVLNLVAHADYSAAK